MRWTSCSIALTLSAALLIPPAAQAQTPLPAGEVARVGETPVLKSDYDHWLAIAARSAGTEPDPEDEQLRAQVMQLLISFLWIEGEAARLGVVVSPGAVTTVYRRHKRESFPRERDFRRFLEETGQTVADLRRRVRLDITSNRLRDRAVGNAKTSEGQMRRLDRYVERFTARWKAKTVCVEGFDNEQDCGTVVPPST